jgi:two-component system OmpR family response regulator
MAIAKTQLQTSFPGARVLIVDDEATLRHTLEDLFSRVGYEADSVSSGPKALEILRDRVMDVVLLDLKMPEMEGTEVLERARSFASDADTIFIIMTAYGTMESAITGIRHGASDYLLKPSSLDTIVRTVERGLVKREEKRRRLQDPIQMLESALAKLKEAPQPQAPPEARFLRATGLLVDKEKHLVLRDNDPVHLTPTEFDVLVYLVQNRNRVVTPVEIVEHLRGYTLDEDEASAYIRSHIYRLRRKLESGSEAPEYIRTVRGRGYSFVSP